MDDKSYDCDMIAYGIGNYLVKYGRICVSQTKEKFGSVRVYCYFGYSCIYNIFYPRRMYIHWPKWLYRIDLAISPYVLKIINPLVIPYQKFIYKKAYAKAVEENPHLAREIILFADWSEFLEDLKIKYAKQLKDMDDESEQS